MNIPKKSKVYVLGQTFLFIRHIDLFLINPFVIQYLERMNELKNVYCDYLNKHNQHRAHC